jgi:hypothetical protein
MTEEEKDSNDKVDPKPGAGESSSAEKAAGAPAKDDDSPLGSTDQHSGG